MSRLLLSLFSVLLAAPAAAGDLASFQLSTRWYPDSRLPCSSVPAPLVDAWANMSPAPIYIRSVHATLSTPPGMNSDTGLNVDLFHDPRYGGQVPLYHESVDHYAEPDSPSSLPPYEFAPDYVIVRPGEYLQLHVGCALQPGNRATPAWLTVTVTIFYTTERPSGGGDLLWGWLDTDPMILPCGTGAARQWVNEWGVPIGLRLLHVWPGISGGATVRARAEVWAERPIRETQIIRPLWYADDPVGRDRLLRHVWDRYAEPSGGHGQVVTFRADRVVLLPGERLSFEVACEGLGYHQQNLLFFYTVG